MKNVWLVIALLAGCLTQGFAQSSSRNGALVVQERDLKGFTSVENNGSLYVRIEQGPECTVRIESVEDFFPYVHTVVNDSVLFIDVPETALRKLRKTKVFITLPEVRHLRNSGAGKMEVPDYAGTEVRIDNDGAGSLLMQFTGNQLDCRNSGVGLVTLTGSAENASFSNRGAGQIKAKEMKAENASVENDGVGGVDIFCSGELSVINRGLGSVRYSGAGVLKYIDSQGLGSVKKIETKN